MKFLDALAFAMVVSGTVLATIQLLHHDPIQDVLALAAVTFGPAATIAGRSRR